MREAAASARQRAAVTSGRRPTRLAASLAGTPERLQGRGVRPGDGEAAVGPRAGQRRQLVAGERDLLVDGGEVGLGLQRLGLGLALLGQGVEAVGDAVADQVAGLGLHAPRPARRRRARA